MPPGCRLAQPDFDAGAQAQQCDLPDSHPGIRRGPDRADPGQRDPRQSGRQCDARSGPLEYAGGRISRFPAGPFPARRTTTATTAPSPDSAGRRRTSRCCCSPARRTTSRWASPASCFRRSGMKHRRASFATVPNTVTDTRGQYAARGDQRDREIRLLPALPRAAGAISRHAGRFAIHRAGPHPVHLHRLRAVPHAHAADGQRHGRGSAQSDRQSLLRPAGARHGHGTGRRRQPGTGGTAASSAARRCGASDSGSSSCTTGGPSNLVEAIQEHRSEGSEANGVIRNFNSLRESQKQDILNFLRSL